MLQMHYAPIVTSKYGITSVLTIYAILIVAALIGASQLEIEFKQSFMMPGEAYIKQYFDKNDEYFQSGLKINVYTDGEMDFTDEKIQRGIQRLNWKLLDCRGCK